MRRIDHVAPMFLPPLWASTAAPGTGFAKTLNPLFRHPRGLTCHPFNRAHSHGLSYSAHRSRDLCDTGHHPQRTVLKGGEWQAPLARFDWTGLAPRETCGLVKGNTGGADAAWRLREHLLHDGCIHWALDSGMTQAGQPSTSEGGSMAWQGAVEAWLAGGMRCE